MDVPIAPTSEVERSGGSHCTAASNDQDSNSGRIGPDTLGTIYATHLESLFRGNGVDDLKSSFFSSSSGTFEVDDVDVCSFD